MRLQIDCQTHVAILRVGLINIHRGWSWLAVLSVLKLTDCLVQYHWQSRSVFTDENMRLEVGLCKCSIVESNTLDWFQPEFSSAKCVYNNNPYSELTSS